MIVLVYHRIGAEKQRKPKNEEDYYTVAVDDFRRQMEFLKNNRYLVPQFPSTPATQSLRLERRRLEHWGTAVITFDDGYASNYTLALPILKEFGFTAVFFITTDNIGREGYMTAKEIKKASDSGITIGSHGMSHRFLTELKDSEVDKELQYSKISLEEIIGKPVSLFSAPGGFYNRRIKQRVKAAGYSAVYTSEFGVNKPGCDPFCLKRIPVKSATTMTDFQRLLNANGSAALLLRAAWKTKYAVKKIIGVENYTSIKELLIKR
ncbi:MAG: polysaccharide deacetylase family protein [Candidatus Omnitrophota bacterium]